MIRRTVTALLLGALLVSSTGCVGGIGANALTPKVSPPDIAKAGVLRAAVDLSYPPFAGSVKGQQVGLDIDVASAIAEQLGLKLEIVDAKPAAAAALVTSGSVDVVFGALTVDAAVSSQIAFAGTYVSDAPAAFVAKGSAVALDDLSTKRIAVQKESLAYWLLLDTYGEAPLVVVPTLEEAFKAVISDKADLVAGDALVGTYLLRDHPTFAYVGQVGSAYPLGVGVSQQKPKLEARVRAVLDKLASQGVLETIRRKWFADLAPLKVIGAPGSAETSGSVEASATP
jgi:polar amino acid transport system substrate-binding protein